MFPAGSLYVPGAETLVPQLKRLTQFAVAHNISIIATADAHSENDPEFQQWPHHCIVGTIGQIKIAATSVSRAAILRTTPDAWLDVESVIERAPQIIVEKQQLDAFSNPHLNKLLSRLHASKYVVYGVATELCVQHVLFGLLKTGIPVYLVADAIKSIDEAVGREMVARFEKEGGILTNTEAIVAPS